MENINSSTQDDNLTSNTSAQEDVSELNKAIKTADEKEDSANSDTARSVLDKTKDTAGEFYTLAAEKTASKINEQRVNLSGGISGVADKVRQIGESLKGDSDEPNVVGDFASGYVDVVAQKIEGVSDYFQSEDLQTIKRDVERFARRQPTLFITAAFAAGLLAARFLKSSSSSPERKNF